MAGGTEFLNNLLLEHIPQRLTLDELESLIRMAGQHEELGMLGYLKEMARVEAEAQG